MRRMLRYYALVDHSTSAILALSHFAPAIHFLEEAMPDSRVAGNLQVPNYLTDFPIDIERPETFIEWTWNQQTRSLKKTPAAVASALRMQADLAVRKLRLFRRIMISLSIARQGADRGMLHQSIVYMTKKAQAQRFKDAGYDDALLLEIPYVSQYADYANLTLKAAAEEILFKAKLDDEKLARTELMRLVYSNKLKRAASAAEVDVVAEEFALDQDRNARL